MKKLSVSLLVLISAVFIMCGCEKEKEKDEVSEYSGGKYTSEEIYETVSMAMKDMPSMIKITSQSEDAKGIFEIISKMDYDKIYDYVFSYSEEGYADEIVVIQVKDSEDAKELKDDLEERLASRKATFATYNVDEGSKFEGATVLSKGNYLVLLIGNQAQNAKYEFNKLFKD